MKTVAVFCGASNGVDPIYIEEAHKLGNALAKNGIGLVYGGSNTGCVGAVANGVLEAGGNAIGVIPEKLMNYEIAHEKLTELHIVKTMHERKAMMAELADGFIALPGGTGTLEEWFEVFTWQQIGYHQKPCALMNINHYYDPVITLFDHMIEQGFVKPVFRELIILESEPAQLLDRLKNNPPAPINRWG
ncbi:TIGR00730 family Rossman fold protein [Gracilibacillus salinarum]|uniref:Cytokinin riboside 5'-monophosphate phosphoribohydrolase n=1 Tax=Gracilibacillus salinarum TaxID=2932255 RepID=A0ABY4GIS4_9BACI|nr:TIGR00730 family Rossman fold protein [Gracilibacillus salinarum]UOQ84091.1 TIGR00730 family Rossman fold protein [Gracilibacillus salinarum]